MKLLRKNVIFDNNNNIKITFYKLLALYKGLKTNLLLAYLNNSLEYNMNITFFYEI